MTVIKSTPSLTPVLYAVLWTGKKSWNDLKTIPNFTTTPADIYVMGEMLHVYHGEDELEEIARPGLDYVVRGVTGYFFVCSKETFEKTYLPIIGPEHPLWTEQHIENVLGHGNRPVTYEEAYNLATRIAGHYETQIGMARAGQLDLPINEYQIEGGRPQDRYDITLCRRRQLEGPDKWAIYRNSWVLNKDGEWEYEPIPSSRDTEFLARCRFDSPEEALNCYRSKAQP